MRARPFLGPISYILFKELVCAPAILFRLGYYGLPDLCYHWSGVGEVRSNIRVGLRRLQSVPLCANVQFHLFGSSAIQPQAAGGRKLAPFPFQIPLHISLYLINLAIAGNRLS